MQTKLLWRWLLDRCLTLHLLDTLLLPCRTPYTLNEKSLSWQSLPARSHRSAWADVVPLSISNANVAATARPRKPLVVHSHWVLECCAVLRRTNHKEALGNFRQNASVVGLGRATEAPTFDTLHSGTAHRQSIGSQAAPSRVYGRRGWQTGAQVQRLGRLGFGGALQHPQQS